MTISASIALVRRRAAPVGQLRRRPDQLALDDEQQRHRAADRDRQIGRANRQKREFGDDLLPCRGNEPRAQTTMKMLTNAISPSAIRSTARRNKGGSRSRAT